MRLQNTVYSVLLISSADRFTESVCSLLSPAEHAPIERAGSISAAKRILSRRQFDFVIINAPLPDESGVDFACEVSENSHSAVLVFTRNEMYAAVYEQLTPFGVFTLNKPLSQQSLMTALLWLAAARERLRKTESKAVSIEQKMQEIRTVNKAKWLLLDREQMSEAQAHRFIEKEAMNRCVPKLVIAKEIIQKYET